MTTVSGPTVDGRTQRRERNVEAVLEVVHRMLEEGRTSLPPEEIAARSGVSLRSLYRYFPDREGLVMASLKQELADTVDLFVADDVGEGPRADRIRRFVRQRLAVHDVMAPTARAALAAARDMPLLAEAVRSRRAQMRSVVDAQFAPELATLDTPQREACAESIDLLCQFESLETLRVTREFDADRVETVLTTALTSLLATVDAAPSGPTHPTP